jgi:hypothetical protein
MSTNVIYNKQKLERIVSFQGLPHVGKCSPADIDICIEIGNAKKYLIGDFKETGKDLDTGQKILLERHCEAFEARGYSAVAFLAWHDPEIKIIDAAQAIVVKYFNNGIWHDVFWQNESLLIRYCRFFNIQKPEDINTHLDELNRIANEGWNNV